MATVYPWHDQGITTQPGVTAQLCTCPRCGHPAQREEAPNGETYITCGHCAAITFDATGEEDSAFYVRTQAPIDIPSVLEVEDIPTCHCGAPATWEVREGLMLHLVCEACYQSGFVDNKLRITAWEATELPPPVICHNCAGPHFTYQCPQIGAALNNPEGIKARVPVLSPTEALRLALERGIFGLPETVDKLRAALEAADQEALLRAEQLAAARAHAASTWDRWQEERAAGAPF